MCLLDFMPVIGYHMGMSKMYSTKQAAEALGLSPDHIKRLARDGDLKAVKLGHDWVILSLKYERKRKPKGA
jgi:excisionase family DNA binding protein